MFSMSEKIDKAVLNENLIKLQQGDEHAFDRVYEMTSKSVYILCFSVLKDSYKAEDIMQNTFIKVRTNVSQYEPNTNPLAWILTIAKSLAINEYNRVKRDVPTDFSEPTMQKPYVDKNLEAVENQQILKKAFEVLNERERNIVLLHTMKGMKHNDIAKVYDLTLSNTLWIYHNSLKKLRKALEGEFDE